MQLLKIHIKEMYSSITIYIKNYKIIIESNIGINLIFIAYKLYLVIDDLLTDDSFSLTIRVKFTEENEIRWFLI